MSRTTEQERLLTANSGNNKNVLPKVGSKEFEKMFPIVEIEKVSLEDRFMQYEPKTLEEKWVKESIIKAKEINLKNFRKPAMDPSFADDGETIIYCAEEKPALGKSPLWWEENALKFMPEKNSRMIDELEKYVWSGMLIRDLIEEGYGLDEAWKAVCVDSTEIGHYCNSKDAKHGFELTGSRQIGKWFDLGNTKKIVTQPKSSPFLGFIFFGGDYEYMGETHSVASRHNLYNEFVNNYGSVGELVLDV